MRRGRKLWLAPMGLFFGSWVIAQMVPDAPIEHFRLPVFNEEGYRSWELRGLKGHYLDEANVRVEGLELIIFDSENAQSEESRIRSPEALIRFEENTAEGPSSLFLSGEGFQVQGKDWKWFAETRTLEVRKEARVRINGELNLIK